MFLYKAAIMPPLSLSESGICFIEMFGIEFPKCRQAQSRRCCNRQILGGVKDFWSNSPNVFEKFLFHFLPTNFLPQRSRSPFFGVKKVFINWQRWAPVLSGISVILPRYLGILPGFLKILPGFPHILPKFSGILPKFLTIPLLGLILFPLHCRLLHHCSERIKLNRIALSLSTFWNFRARHPTSISFVDWNVQIFLFSVIFTLDWMLLLLNSDYGTMEKILKLNRFLAKVWASRHIKFISPPYSRM